MLGLTLREPELNSAGDVAPLVELLLDIRSDLRAAKQYDLADKIRVKLDDLGVTIEDTPGGAEWRRRT